MGNLAKKIPSVSEKTSRSTVIAAKQQCVDHTQSGTLESIRP